MSEVNKEKQDMAYPMQYADDSYQTGMTLRDYFAAKAMQGMLSSPNCPMQVDNSELANISYEVADAMLEARK